jgi:hypothetical protein
MKKRFLIPLLSTIVAVAAAPARSDIIYVSNEHGTIEKFDSTTGADLGIFTTTSGGLGALALDRSANLYAAVPSVNVILKYSPAISVFAITKASALAFDNTGNLFASDYDGATIKKFAPDGTYLGVFATTGSTGPSGLAFDSVGNLYATMYAGNTIKKYSPNGAVSTFGVVPGPYGILGLAFDSSDNLYVGNQYDSTIHKFSSDGTDLGIFASTALSYPRGLSFDSSGNLYVANYGNTVTEFSPNGDLVRILTSPNFTNPQFIAIQVPEPSTLALLVVGAPLFLGRRRRRS